MEKEKKKKGKEKRKRYKPSPTQGRRGQKGLAVTIPKAGSPVQPSAGLQLFQLKPYAGDPVVQVSGHLQGWKKRIRKKKWRCGHLRTYSVLMECAGICKQYVIHVL